MQQYCSMVASMHTSIEGTLATMGNMPKQNWSNIAPILGVIGERTRVSQSRTVF